MNELQKARKEKGLTNGQIAKALELSESYVSKVIAGHWRPQYKLNEYDRIREFLGVKDGNGAP